MNEEDIGGVVSEISQENLLRELAADDQNPIFGENNDLVKSISALLDDSEAANSLKDSEFWIANTKSLKLSIVDRRDRSKYLNMFEALVLMKLMSTPNQEFTLEEMTNVNQARMLFHLNVDRAIGTSSVNKKNERVLLSTQIKEIATHAMGKEKRGLFRRVLGV